MASSKQAIVRRSSPTIHDGLTISIITETARRALSLPAKKADFVHNLPGCCMIDTVAR
jgi:hypothetical protein